MDYRKIMKAFALESKVIVLLLHLYCLKERLLLRLAFQSFICFQFLCVRKRNVKKSYLFFPPSFPWPLVHDPVEYINVCQPSPCGINAVCREQNGVGSCTCIEDHLGNPYEGCHPECVLNSDCPSNKACVRNKCQDPCPGVCGQNALCNVVNHLPQCNCLPGYTGDPFRFCSVIRDERKNFEL